jgi:aminoglycoside phosphotransferase (APT) family kinase protein
VVGAGTVRDFVAQHLGPLAGRPLRLLAVGDFSTWLADESIVVRFAFDDEGDRQLHRESAALRVLAPRLNVSVPEIAILDRAATGHLAVAYPLLPGTSGEDRRPEGPALAAAADVVAECLTRLHAIDPDDVGADLPRWEVDHASRLADVVELAEVVRRMAPGHITPVMQAYLDGTVDVPSPATDRALCHTDLKGEHVLLDPRTSRITGVIDWADIAVDDPAVDLGSLAIWLGEGFVRAVAERYGARADIVERGLFRIRTWLLTGFARMLLGQNGWPEPLVKTQVTWAFGP